MAPWRLTEEHRQIRPRASELFMAKGHTRYRGLVRGADVEKVTVSGIPTRINYCVILIVDT